MATLKENAGLFEIDVDLKFLGAGKGLDTDQTYIPLKVGGAEQVRVDGGGIKPASDSTKDLGSATLRFANLFVDNIGDAGQTLNFTGTMNFNSDTFYVDSVSGKVSVGIANPVGTFHIERATGQVSLYLSSGDNNGSIINLERLSVPGVYYSTHYRTLFE